MIDKVSKEEELRLAIERTGLDFIRDDFNEGQVLIGLYQGGIAPMTKLGIDNKTEKEIIQISINMVNRYLRNQKREI